LKHADVPRATSRGKVRYRAREFLALADAEFVRTASVAIFGHEPAPDEFIRQRDRLLTGEITRARLLSEFLSRTDAKPDVKIDGLTRLIAWGWLERSLPAKIIRVLATELRNIYLLPGRFQQLFARVEALERRSAAKDSAAEDHANFLTAAIADQRLRLDAFLIEAKGRLDAAPDQLSVSPQQDETSRPRHTPEVPSEASNDGSRGKLKP
jgi:hypothetical protein